MSTKKDKFTQKDRSFMNLALNLARSRHGLTGNNPSVGCVIVKDNNLLAIGQTSFNGRPHAESNAMKSSYENLKGSKMYITLEPCNHYGVTPPCTKEIIKNKIKEVIYSINDIDKKVKGKSFNILKSKKIIVKKGLMEKEINDFYKSYKFNREKKIPYVTGKIAVSKNNLIYSGKKEKITDLISNKFNHFLRYKNDSIMISSKTLNIDNPKLNCRLASFNKFSPRRIILDKNLETKINSYIFKTAHSKNTIIFYNEADKKKIKLFKKKSIIMIKLKLNHNKKFDLNLLLKKLYKLGCRNLLVEGGNDLSNSFFKQKLFNQFYLFKSPKKLFKFTNFVQFNCFKYLSQNYTSRSKLFNKLGKDKIYLYKN